MKEFVFMCELQLFCFRVSPVTYKFGGYCSSPSYYTKELYFIIDKEQADKKMRRLIIRNYV